MGPNSIIHLHLLLNHLPTVGTVVAVGLFLLALAAKNDYLRRVTLGVFFIIALLTLPAYMSGNAAAALIAELPDMSEALIARHQDAALVAFGFMQLTGLVAWMGLWEGRRGRQPARWNTPAIVLLSLVTLALMSRAATMGGEIGHPEIRPAAEAAATSGGAAWYSAESIASFVITYPWVWPTSEALHFIGMCLLVGIVMVTNLRILGMIRRVSFEALHRLLPIAIFGFAIMVISGMLFFITFPAQYTQNPSFFWKMGFILLGGVNVLYLTTFEGPWGLGPGDQAAPMARVLAGSAMFVWFGVIFWGIMLPFLGLQF